MRITSLYWRFGGSKDSFLYKKYMRYCHRRERAKMRRALKEYGMEMLEMFFQACRQVGVNSWLAYGTLLGAYRDKAFMPHDFDLDVAMRAEDFSDELEQLLLSKGFKRLRDFSLVNVVEGTARLTELCYIYRELSIDVFLSFEDIDHRLTYAYTNEYTDETLKKRLVKLYRLSKPFPSTVMTINGHEFPGPSDPQNDLMRIYGSDFMVPQPEWKPTKSNPYAEFFDADSYYGRYNIYKV